MFYTNKIKSWAISVKEEDITFVSYYNRSKIIAISFLLIGFLIILVYLIRSVSSPILACIIPYAIFTLIILIYLVTLLFGLPLTVVLKGDALKVEMLLSSIKFNRDDIIAFEVRTESMLPYRGWLRRWRHSLVLHTFENGNIYLATQPSLRKDINVFTEASNVLNRWLTS